MTCEKHFDNYDYDDDIFYLDDEESESFTCYDCLYDSYRENPEDAIWDLLSARQDLLNARQEISDLEKELRKAVKKKKAAKKKKVVKKK